MWAAREKRIARSTGNPRSVFRSRSKRSRSMAAVGSSASDRELRPPNANSGGAGPRSAGAWGRIAAGCDASVRAWAEAWVSTWEGRAHRAGESQPGMGDRARLTSGSLRGRAESGSPVPRGPVFVPGQTNSFSPRGAASPFVNVARIARDFAGSPLFRAGSGPPSAVHRRVSHQCPTRALTIEIRPETEPGESCPGAHRDVVVDPPLRRRPVAARAGCRDGDGPGKESPMGPSRVGLGEYAAASLFGAGLLPAAGGRSGASERVRRFFLVRFAAAEAIALFGLVVGLRGAPLSGRPCSSPSRRSPHHWGAHPRLLEGGRGHARSRVNAPDGLDRSGGRLAAPGAF